MTPGFNPAALAMGLGHELFDGFAATAFPWGFDVTQEGLSAELQRIERQTIQSSRDMLESLKGKLAVAGQTTHEVNPEAMIPFLGNVFERYDYSNIAPGVERLRFSTHGANPVPKSYSVRKDQDDGRVVTLAGGKTNTLTLNLAPSSLLTCQIDHVFESLGFWGAVAATVDPTPNASLPQVRGILGSAAINAAAGEEVFIAASDVAGLSEGVISVLVKVGAAPFGAIPTQIRLGSRIDTRPFWSTLYDSVTGEPIGSAQLQMAFPGDRTGIEVGDTWQFDRLAGTFLSVIPEVLPFSEINSIIKIQGVEEETDSIQIAMTNPTAPKPQISSSFSRSRRAGTRSASATIGREHVGNETYDLLMAGEPFSLEADLRTAVAIPGTTHRHRWRIVAPRMVPSGTGPTTTSATERQESITATAHADPTNADGFTAPLTVEVTSRVADPTV